MPDSTLKNKSLSVAYQLSREGTAAGEWLSTYINTNGNATDLHTPSQLQVAKKDDIFPRCYYIIFMNGDYGPSFSIRNSKTFVQKIMVLFIVSGTSAIP